MPLPEWLHREPLSRVWRLVGEALERRELVARGRITVRGLTREERHALSDVMGRPVTSPELRLDLGFLEDRVAGRTGLSLAGVVGGLTGRVLVDRAVARRDAEARRELPFEAAQAWLSDRTERRGPVAGWVMDWLDALRRDGILTGWEDRVDLIETALTILESRGILDDASSPQTGSDDQPDADGRLTHVPRTELAATSAGDAHALDDGTRLGALVLRAAAARASTALPSSAADRRSLWESIGVVNDRVSTTCLTWRLVAPAALLGGSTARPTHVTWWDLEDGLVLAATRPVLVCENPGTLEAVASLEHPGLGMVCTMGRPNLVVMEVLERLVAQGARLFYHGDFDWAGLAMANACQERFGAEPWLMSTADYLAGHGSQPLKGIPVDATWDADLSAAMRHRGVAVHEEAQLDVVLSRCAELVR